MQGDLYDDKVYYYDLQSDIANLGSLRDTLQKGDTFTHNDQEFEIIEREEFNQCFVIQKVEEDMNDVATKEIDLWDFEQRDVETLVEIIEAKLHDMDIFCESMSFSINVEYTPQDELDD
tara:strand:+ start:209 stop:565 length:357 start_codon:yes stop_codon:yes gene_type:complete